MSDFYLNQDQSVNVNDRPIKMKNTIVLKCTAICALFLIAGCNDNNSTSTTTPQSFNFSSIAVSKVAGTGSFSATMSWEASSGATSYKVCKKDKSQTENCRLLSTTSSTTSTVDIGGPLSNLTSEYFVIASNSGGTISSNEKSLTAEQLRELVMYIKASNSDAGDTFGRTVALSSDGSTMVVGSYQEDSNATGVDGDQLNNSASNSGAVYVYVRTGDIWSQQAYLKASNTEATDSFGNSLSISGDGNTIAISAYLESSNATGVNGDQASNSANGSGAVYVFNRTGSTWSQQSYLKASNTEAGDGFGIDVSLSKDGNTLAVGARGEDSNATGINGDSSNNSVANSGSAYVFVRSGNTWSQQAYVKASNPEANDYFGQSVSISGDGTTLAVAAYQEDSNATGVNGNQADNSTANSGAVYVYTRTGSNWSQQAYVKASNPDANDYFGRPLVLNGDGNTLAIGAAPEDSNATSVDGNQADNSASSAGAVYVFNRTGNAWSQQAYIKASNAETNDRLGTSLAISSSGNTIAIGAQENSGSTLINGDQADNSADTSGAVYVFTRSNEVWTQKSYIKAPNADSQDYFGRSVAIDESAGTLVVGANNESSKAKGINGDLIDNTNANSGAVYIY